MIDATKEEQKSVILKLRIIIIREKEDLKTEVIELRK